MINYDIYLDTSCLKDGVVVSTNELQVQNIVSQMDILPAKNHKYD